MYKIFIHNPSIPDDYYEISGVVSRVINNSSGSSLYLEKAVIKTDVKNYVAGIMINVVSTQYQKGDAVYAAGKLRSFEEKDNPGQFDYKKYYYSMNVYYQMTPEDIYITQKCTNCYYNIIFKIKNKLYNSYEKIASKRTAGVCISMVLGDKSSLSDELNSIFKDNGISHILAISGLHIALIGMLLYKILKGGGLSFVVSAGISTVIIISYGIMTGNSVSTIRAIIMFLMVIYAKVLGRSYDVLSAILLSAIVILIRYPYMIYNSGFYLSFFAVFGIAFLEPAISFYFPYKNKILQALRFSIAVSLTTFPMLMYFYYELAGYSFLLNLIVVPLMEILMLSAITAGIAGIISVKMGIFLVGAADGIIRFYEKICLLVSVMKNAKIIVGVPELVQIICYYIIIVIYVYISLRLKVRYRPSNMKRLGYGKVRLDKLLKRGKIVTLLIFISSISILMYRDKDRLRITCLSVGQGDCMVISTKDINILIDGGSTTKKNIGKKVIIPYLKYCGIDRLDYCVITHPDKDHYSGIEEIVESKDIKVDNYVLSYLAKDNKQYADIKAFIKGSGNEKTSRISYISESEVLVDNGELLVRCLHPASNYEELIGHESENNESIVLYIKYKGVDMITTGDLEEEGEESILNQYNISNIDILKCGHHGSASSSGEKWINSLKPKISLISCGYKNSYGHPHQEVIKRLEDIGSKIYRTDTGGAIIIDIRDRLIIREYKNIR